MTRPTCPRCGDKTAPVKGVYICAVCGEVFQPRPSLPGLLARMRRARECIETLAKEDAQHEQPA